MKKNIDGDQIMFCKKHVKIDKDFRLYVVCNQLRPKFDVHITNYVTVINFAINLESLT